MTSMSNVKVMWLVTGLDVDYEWNVAVCHSRKAAKNLVAKLEADQDDNEMRYSYYIATVTVFNEEEDED